MTTVPKSVLCATDLSPPAHQAAQRAARIASETGAVLTLLHVLPKRPLDDLREWLGATVEQQMLDQARCQLAAWADELRAARQVPVQARAVGGAVLDVVAQTADELDAGLVVLGARGAGFLRRMVLGATAERLLRRTTRPFLVVRQSAHEPYRRALLALDFSPWSGPVLALAQQVAPQARWVLFHAFQVPFEEKLHFAGVEPATIEHYRRQARAAAAQRLHGLAGKAGLKAGTWDACIVEGEASQRLVEQEQAQDCDLVVLGKHGKSAAEDLLLGSVTKHVIAEGTADLLVATMAQPGR